MPELPEVETVKNNLKEMILNRKILSVDVRYDKIIANINIEDFKKKLVNEKINDIKRKGKYLIFILDNYYLLSHLRMEGKFFLRENKDYTKHDHIIFHFENDNLRYNDTRKFGRMYLFNKNEDIYNIKPLSDVSYEAFDKELTVDYLKSKLEKSSRQIKTVLLDQRIMSGLGNIYVDEVLFMAKIHPTTSCVKLKDEDYKNIIEYSKIVLTKAIKLGGTTIKSFTNSHEISGRFQNELLVHTKKNCPICNSKIEKIYVNGRGTYYCKSCQKIDK